MTNANSTLDTSSPTMDGFNLADNAGAKTVTLVLQGTTTSEQEVEFVLNMPNPTSQTIASSDMEMEALINNKKIHKATSLSSGKTFQCNTGCTGCTDNY
jgi:hypothetical protein